MISKLDWWLTVRGNYLQTKFGMELVVNDSSQPGYLVELNLVGKGVEAYCLTGLRPTDCMHNGGS